MLPDEVQAWDINGNRRVWSHNGQQLDIKSAPFEATVTATE